MNYIFIAIGSGIGGIARYALSKWVYELSAIDFPVGTMAVNLCGCFLIGFLTGVFGHWTISPHMRMFVFVGFLGGFTTFSTFGLETFNLLRETDFRFALANVLVTNIAGILLVFLGYFAFQAIVKYGRL